MVNSVLRFDGDRDWQVSSGSTWVRVAVTQFWADLHSHTGKSLLQDLAMLVNHLPLSLEADPIYDDFSFSSTHSLFLGIGLYTSIYTHTDIYI